MGETLRERLLALAESLEAKWWIASAGIAREAAEALTAPAAGEGEAVQLRRKVLEAVVAAGHAHIEQDYQEAYHRLYWLLVDGFGLSHYPLGPFENAELELKRGAPAAQQEPAPDWSERERKLTETFSED